ncbi:cysteine desulfurase [Candidatus Saccharibacteria bacterium]|nr:cysteine desulfurase [Candidatus Saccharibacteria bacterium]
MIYLDHAAATPVSKKALAKMLPYFSDEFFNPSSPYLPAAHLRQNYEFAKGQIAHTIGAKGNDIVITAGATESINLAFTAAEGLSGNILILETEHPSVRATARALVENSAKGGKSPLELREIKVDKTGLIDLDDLRQKIDENTIFISVSLANNELGTIQPLAEISEIIEKERSHRLELVKDKKPTSVLPIILHSDASQALNLVDISVARLGVDLLTINAAKVGGPKGVGALYVGRGIKLNPIIVGGGQEAGLRSGTENVPGVMGFAVAAEETKEHLAGNRKKYEKFAQILKNKLQESPIEPLFLGNKKHQLANFVPVCFPGIDAERIIYKLEEKQVYLSTGAACAANKGAKSHVLTAIGLTDSEIAGSLRISLGVLNTEENVKKAGELIVQAVSEEFARVSGDQAQKQESKNA